MPLLVDPHLLESVDLEAAIEPPRPTLRSGAGGFVDSRITDDWKRALAEIHNLVEIQHKMGRAFDSISMDIGSIKKDVHDLPHRLEEIHRNFAGIPARTISTRTSVPRKTLSQFHQTFTTERQVSGSYDSSEVQFDPVPIVFQSEISAVPSTNSAPERSPMLDAQASSVNSALSMAQEVLLLNAMLPPTWPRCLESQLANSDVQISSEEMTTLASSQARRSMTMDTHNSALSIELTREKVFRYFCTSPDSMAHLFLESCKLIVLIYDLTAIPLVVAWDIAITGLIRTISWATACFWTFDLFDNLTTAYYSNGLLVTDPIALAKRYAKTWLMPDLLAVTCDWTSLILVSAYGESMQKFVRIARMLRLVGVYRVVKIVRFLEYLLEGNLAEAQGLAIKILTIVMGLLWLNHLLACLWFVVGCHAQSDTGLHWPENFSSEFKHENFFYQYTTTFHWGVAQISLGAMEVTANNSIERVVNVACLLLGLICGCTLVASLSASMVDYQMTQNDKINKLRVLRKFLRDGDVSWQLARKVQQHVVDRLGAKERLGFEDVHVFSLVSATLRAEVRLEIFRPQLVRHGLFRLWDELDGDGDMLLKRLCTGAMDYNFLVPQDDLFIPGPELCQGAYYIGSGSLSYIQTPACAPVEEESKTQVCHGQWLCEAGLWCYWNHVGTAVANENCQFMVLRPDAIADILKMQHIVRDVTYSYGCRFHRCIIHAVPPYAPWPTDLDVPSTDFADILMSFEQPMQVVIGLNALQQQMSGYWKINKVMYSNLEEEVRSGKSVLMVDAHGDLQRVTASCVARLEREDKKILVQLAKEENDGRMALTCKLPGLKQESGESTPDALTRVLEDKLKDFKLRTTIKGMTREVDWKHSKEYGCRTKYWKTQYVLSVLEHIEPDVCPLKVGFSTDLTHRPVYIVHDDLKVYLYTWLLPDEFESTATTWKESLAKWMFALDLSATRVSFEYEELTRSMSSSPHSAWTSLRAP